MINLDQKKMNFLNRLSEAKKQKLYFYMMKIDALHNGHAIVEGKECINFTSNDYLGLANHPKIKESAIEAIKKYGVATGQTRLFGEIALHEELEKKIADFVGAEDTLLFNSGYAANVGTISALIEEGDYVISDERNHASIIDGCKMSRGKIIVYKHNSMAELKNILSMLEQNRKKLIVVDSVFSMDGDLANIPEICVLKEKYNVILMVDEAHATGTMGEKGRGIAEHFKLEGKLDITMGSLGKSLGSMGGFICADKNLIDFLKHNARSFVFTTALPPPLVAPVITAIDLIKDNPELVDKLQSSSAFMRKELKRSGFDIGETQTQIIPIKVGNDLEMFKLVKGLFENGIAVNAVVFPAVPEGGAKVRICISAVHSKNDLTKALEIIIKLGKKFGLTEDNNAKG